MSLVFYYAPMSSASTTHWALEELGVPYEKVKIDLASKVQTKPEFLAINPNAKVPALVHDGTALFESVAILIHLGETFGVERGLFPAPGLKRAEAIKWLVWFNVSVGAALARYLPNISDEYPSEARNAKAGEIAKTDIEHLLDILDASLAGKEYLVGDSFTLADLHLSGGTSYLGYLGFDLARWPAIQALTKRTQARPAYARVMTA